MPSRCTLCPLIICGQAAFRPRSCLGILQMPFILAILKQIKVCVFVEPRVSPIIMPWPGPLSQQAWVQPLQFPDLARPLSQPRHGRRWCQGPTLESRRLTSNRSGSIGSSSDSFEPNTKDLPFEPKDLPFEPNTKDFKGSILCN